MFEVTYNENKKKYKVQLLENEVHPATYYDDGEIEDWAQHVEYCNVWVSTVNYSDERGLEFTGFEVDCFQGYHYHPERDKLVHASDMSPKDCIVTVFESMSTEDQEAFLAEFN